MIALRPRPTALSAYANISSGMRCAETTLASWAMPNSARISVATRMVSQSLLEPMTTPTTAGALLTESVPGVSGSLEL